MEREAVHLDPAWRERANFVIAASLPGDQERTEQLWARQIGAFRFEVCCVPFFVYELSLGDEVVTDERFIVADVVRSSGRSTLRVWFGDSTGVSTARDLEQRLVALGCLTETSSHNLLAVDAATPAMAARAIDYLQELQHRGELVFEVGKLVSSE